MMFASVMMRALAEVPKDNNEQVEVLQQELVQMVGTSVDKHNLLEDGSPHVEQKDQVQEIWQATQNHMS